jgi:hypothetical protein
VRPHAKVVIVCACLAGLFMPAPAEALWGRGWLERLSGPGPFQGNVYHLRFLCFTSPSSGDDREAATASLDEHASVRRLVAPSVADAQAYASAAGCNFLADDKPRLEVGILVGRMESTANALDYSHLTSPMDTSVKLRTWAITFDVRVNRVLDVGVGAGRASFKPGADASLFTDFGRAMVQPLRVTVRPLAAVSNEKILQALTLRFDATKFAGGFTAEDFGARPGTFNEPGEILWNWSAVIDLGAILWR